MIKHLIIITGIFLFALSAAAAAAAADNDGEAVRDMVYRWRDAWQSKDLDGYTAHYHKDFRSGGVSHGEWMKKKAELFRSSGTPVIDISEPEIRVDGQKATAVFDQRYTSDALSDLGRKTLVLVKTDGRWRIISEEWERLESHSETTTEDADATDATDGIVVKNIAYQLGKSGSERICLGLGVFALPEVIPLTGEQPRIAIDVQNNRSWTGPSQMPIKGTLIQQIRTHYHQDSRKLRIVLDLDPAKDYSVNPAYYKAENIYCVEVRDAASPGPTEAESTPDPNIFGPAGGNVPMVTDPFAMQQEWAGFLSDWIIAWEKTAGPQGDLADYMSFYSEAFSSNGLNKEGWRQDKLAKNQRRGWIRGRLLDVALLPTGDPIRPSVRFYLDYQAPNYHEILEKTLVLQKESNHWKILQEDTRLATGLYSATR